jgi:hypothetical protein
VALEEEMMRTLFFACSMLAVVVAPMGVRAAPTAVGGQTITLVGTGPAGTQLFGLAADPTGKVYTGNNSNNTTGIPVQLFDPSLYVNSPIPLSNFGPNVGDADGIAYGGGNLYVADRDEGVQRIAVPSGSATLYLPGVAINGTGSPLAYRTSDGRLFVGSGAATGGFFIREYSGGVLQNTYSTATDVETMTIDPGNGANGVIYYADFGSNVRKFNLNTLVDSALGTVSGTIDGGMAFDPISGQLFIGTANGTNSGRVETMNPTIGGAGVLFAFGFNGSVGILREQVSTDLYFLESDRLYRIENVPEPTATALIASAALAVLTRRRRLTQP